MNKPRGQHAKRNKLDTASQTLHDLTRGNRKSQTQQSRE